MRSYSHGLWVIFVMTYQAAFIESVCNQVCLQGTQYHADLEGAYQLHDGVCQSGSYAYKRTTSNGRSYFMYDISETDGLPATTWAVGPVMCDISQAVMRVQDDAIGPCDVTDTWQELSDECWTENPEIQMKCEVRLQGTQDHAHLEGVYQLHDGVCQIGSHAYKHTTSNGTNYFMYHLSRLTGGLPATIWAVGPALCVPDQAVMRVQDDAIAPCDVTEIWEEVSRGDWTENPNIDVTPEECSASEGFLHRPREAECIDNSGGTLEATVPWGMMTLVWLACGMVGFFIGQE